MKNNPKEQWQPLPHVLEDTFQGQIIFQLRRFFDFQVGTVYADIKKVLAGPQRNILEVGCGAQPYRQLVSKDTTYHSLEWEGARQFFQYRSASTIYYDGKTFPFAKNTFELLFHTEVAEHVFDIQHFLSECCRVLQPGAKMFFTVPFSARYHYIPHDYWRFTPSCLQKLLEAAGFKDITVSPRGHDTLVMIVKINILFYRIIFMNVPHRNAIILWRLIWGVLFSIPIVLLTLIGHILLFFNIGSEDDPLGYSVYCHKK